MYNSPTLSIVAIALLLGWFINLGTLFMTEVVTGFSLIQAIGIIALPIGVVTGYISLFI
jgi:hypothetical protein